jgi:hypothetical protein
MGDDGTEIEHLRQWSRSCRLHRLRDHCWGFCVQLGDVMSEERRAFWATVVITIALFVMAWATPHLF